MRQNWWLSAILAAFCVVCEAKNGTKTVVAVSNATVEKIPIVVPVQPTKSPTVPPTLPPTVPPTKHPTVPPTRHPTHAPITQVPTQAPITEAPTDAPFTEAPTQATTLAPITMAPTASPSSKPTNSPTSVPSPSPTVFVLRAVPPIPLLNHTVVEGRCLELLESVTDDKTLLASYWSPNSTTPLYYSAPEGIVNASGFTPDEFLNGTGMVPIPTKATNTTPIDVAGSTCSMNLVLKLNGTKTPARALLQLDKQGHLTSWMNSFNSSVASTTDMATRATCSSAMEALFPATGISLNSLFKVVSLFVPNNVTLALPAGNKNTTLANVGGWAVFSFFMAKLNPFQLPTTANITSAIDVAGSVCSFDQQLRVTLAKGKTNCTTLSAPGRVLMEIQGDKVLRFLSQFDNETFWGGIEKCLLAEKEAEEAKIAAKKKEEEEKEAKKKAEKEKKKKAKQEKEAEKKRKKAEKAKAKEEKKAEKKRKKAEKKAKKDKSKKDSDSGSASIEFSMPVLQSMGIDSFFGGFNHDSTAGGVGLGMLFLTLSVFILLAHLRSIATSPRRRGYQVVGEALV